MSKDLINKAFRVRIYPTKDQAQFIKQSCGNSRFIYNYGLELRSKAYQKDKTSLSYKDTAAVLKPLKQINPWLALGPAAALQQSLRDLDIAYTRFFKGHGRYPKFKCRTSGGSFRIPQHFNINTKHNNITLPKVSAPIKAVFHQSLKDFKVKSMTISVTPSGKYYASLQGEYKAKELRPSKVISGSVVGHDLGLNKLLISSDGSSSTPLKAYVKSQVKPRSLQRSLNKKKRGSVRYNKARIKVARLHEHIGNQRLDYLHKLSSRLVGENQANFFEDLNIKSMTHRSYLAKSILDSGWGELIRQVKYKSVWQGKTFGQVETTYPSSQLCSAMGCSFRRKLRLSIRSWTCPQCGSSHDRDINASLNVLQRGSVIVSR